MQHLRFPFALLVVFAVCPLAGCPSPRSEAELLTLENHGISVAATPEKGAYTGAQPVLVGTRTCPTVHCSGECPRVTDAGVLIFAPEVGDCFITAVDGPAVQDDGGCLVFPQAGAVAWRFAPQDCQEIEPDGGWSPKADSFLFIATTRQGVTARFDLVLERLGAATLELGQEPNPEPDYVPLTSFPEDFHPTREKPLSLLAGQRVRLPVALFSGNDDLAEQAPVGFLLAATSFTLNETQASNAGGAAAVIENEAGEFPIVTMAAGGELEVVMDIGNERFTVGTVRGVDANDLVSLDISAFRPEPATGTAVAGFHASVRDDGGEIVFGVPVAWELLQGRYVFGALLPLSGRVPSDVEADPDAPILGAWMSINDGCLPPDRTVGSREVTMQASFGNMNDTVEIAWEQRGPERADDENWTEAEACQGVAPVVDDDAPVDGGPGNDEPTPERCAGGCCCESTGRAPAESVCFGVAMVGLLLRRRVSASRRS